MISPYARRSRPVEESFVGMVREKFPAVTVWLPKVYTATALLDCVELYRRTASKAVLRVTVVQEIVALGVE